MTLTLCLSVCPCPLVPRLVSGITRWIKIMSRLSLGCWFSSAGGTRFRDLHLAPVYTLTIALYCSLFLSIFTTNTRWASFAMAPQPLEVLTVWSCWPRTWLGDRTMTLRVFFASEIMWQPSWWPRHRSPKSVPRTTPQRLPWWTVWRVGKWSFYNPHLPSGGTFSFVTMRRRW